MILIIGGGFIGTALYNDLIDKGYAVKMFSSNFNTTNNNFIKGDYNEIENFNSMFDSVSIIINTIHTTVPATSYQNEIYDVQTNVVSFIKLLNLCKGKGIRKFIYISSGGAVYGNPLSENPVDENYFTNPISSYGITKLSNEKYLLLNQKRFVEGVIILRPSNIYGLGQKILKPQGIIGHLINAGLAGETLEIWGDGSAKKDYLYITDFVNGIGKIIESNPKVDTQVYNISSGKVYTLLELISLIESKMKKQIKIKFVDEKIFDVKNISLNNQLFSDTFGWKAQFDIADGIEEILRKGQH